MPHHKLNIWKVYEMIFKDTSPEKIVFKAGGIFSVSKDLILSEPIEFYENLFVISKSVHEAPWVLERLWGHIFKSELI